MAKSLLWRQDIKLFPDSGKARFLKDTRAQKSRNNLIKLHKGLRIPHLKNNFKFYLTLINIFVIHISTQKRRQLKMQAGRSKKNFKNSPAILMPSALIPKTLTLVVVLLLVVLRLTVVL